MKRLLLLTDVFGGGTGNHLTALFDRLTARGIEVLALSNAPVRSRTTPGFEVRVLPPRRHLDRLPLAQAHRLREIARVARAFRPDVVHSYFFWSIVYGRALRRAGLAPHLVENREDQGFGWGRAEYALLRATRGTPDRVICVAGAVARVAREREGLDAARVAVIHNGVEPPPPRVLRDPAVARRFGLAPGDLVVGMVANFNRPVKGAGYLVEAAPFILAAEPRARFLLVGRGGEEAALRRRAQELGVGERLVFTGRQDDVEPCYAWMDVSVLTSLSEGLSITLLESMRQGLPVVATDVGGNPELVVDGTTGFLVPPRDVGRFAERVVRLLRDPDLRARLGRAARERVVSHFDLDGVASRYLAIYEGGANAPAREVAE